MGSSTGHGTRHKYYAQEEGGVGLGSLQANGRSKSSKYDATVSVTTRSAPGKSEESFEKSDAESERGILPIQSHDIGVVKTVRVSVANASAR